MAPNKQQTDNTDMTAPFFRTPIQHIRHSAKFDRHPQFFRGQTRYAALALSGLGAKYRTNTWFVGPRNLQMPQSVQEKELVPEGPGSTRVAVHSQQSGITSYWPPKGRPQKWRTRGAKPRASSGVMRANAMTMSRSPTLPWCAAAPLRQQTWLPRFPAMA